jgi:hypothetical protein
MEEITKLIDDLQPRAARYDTPIADDLLICTFPNGSRTWIFSYFVDGAQHRRSLGVYPEMSLADARQALCAARKLQQAEANLAAQGLASEVHGATAGADAQPPRPDKPRRWLERRTVSAALAGGLMSIAIYLGARQLSLNLEARAARVTRDAVAAKPAAQTTSDSVAPAQASTAPAVAATEARGGEALDPTTVPAGPADSSAVALSPANQALIRAQQSLRGTVARDTLAHGVERNRPLRTFESQVTLEGDAPTTLYYFTELRGMAGETVSHRWLHEGELVSEISIPVDAGWLSDVHSSATIHPRMKGRWQVLVCDATGKILESEQFEVAPKPQLSSTIPH